MPEEKQLLAFERAGKRFAIPLEDLQGFYGLHQSEKTKNQVCFGRVPARGHWVNVVDLFPNKKYSRTACAVVIERGEARIGIASDLVEGIIAAPNSYSPSRSTLDCAHPEIISGAFEQFGKSYTLIDLDKLFDWAATHLNAPDSGNVAAVAIELLA